MGALKRLTPDEQVGLLFLILFGALLLVTLGAVAYALRTHDESGDNWVRFKRDLRALWVGTVLFWLAWLSGPVGATIFFGLFSFLALREFITLQHTRRSDHRTLILAFFIVLPLQFLIVGLRRFDLFTVFKIGRAHV